LDICPGAPESLVKPLDKTLKFTAGAAAAAAAGTLRLHG